MSACPTSARYARPAAVALRVVLLAYGESRAQPWWTQSRAALARQDNLRVLALDDAALAKLRGIAARSMPLTATIQDGHLWLATPAAAIEIVTQQWLPGQGG